MPRLSRRMADPQKISEEVVIAMTLLRIDKHILASKMDMPLRTLNSKLSTGYWTFEELFTMFSILKMPDGSILKIFGRNQ